MDCNIIPQDIIHRIESHGYNIIFAYLYLIRAFLHNIYKDLALSITSFTGKLFYFFSSFLLFFIYFW